MANQKKKKAKKRQPKGKPLSQRLAEKDAIKEAEEVPTPSVEEPPEAEPPEADELASEPPPSFTDDEDEPEDVEADVPEPVAKARDEEPDLDEEDEDDDEYEDDDEDEAAAAQMGHQRYVIAGFFGLWLIVAYICGQALEMAWANFAAEDWFIEQLPSLAAVPYEGDLISRATVSTVAGAFLGGAIVLRYYFRADIRQWADEVAEQLSHVKWPTRKEVGNNTVICMIASAIITLYLSILDRFWDFATTLVYTAGQ